MVRFGSSCLNPLCYLVPLRRLIKNRKLRENTSPESVDVFNRDIDRCIHTPNCINHFSNYTFGSNFLPINFVKALCKI